MMMQGSLYDYYGWTCGVLKETVAARLPGTPTAVTSLLSRDYLAAISRLQTSLQSVCTQTVPSTT